MLSSGEEIGAAFDALAAARSRLNDLCFDGLTTAERLTYLERLEQEARRAPVAGHVLINQLGEQADTESLGGRLPAVLAARLRITRADAGRRVAQAADLGPRRALSGEPLPPRLAATATAQRAGTLGAAHINIIRGLLKRLPDFVDAPTREHIHTNLATLATQVTPEELSGLAEHVLDCVHPDGDYTDTDRARRRGLTLGTPGADGMRKLTGLLTPDAAAALEAVLAKLAAPGMCHPDDKNPVLDGPAPQEQARRDLRSTAQRNHDALDTAARTLLASGKLGQHNGLPATLVVTTTLTELETAAGTGRTGGGTIVPMSTVLRLAAQAHPYLAIFDGAKPLALYHAHRFASAAQRLMLYAKCRGCTKPGCHAPAYHTQVHHVSGWTTTGRTDINDLTLACGPDNRLAEKGWTTRTNTHGDTEWIPPPHLDHGQPRTNRYHHPEKLLHELTDDDEEDP
jgi:Domain of unknown function (DUF222)